MLGGDREFNDRLCWVLLLPLSALAAGAAAVAMMAAGLAIEGDAPGGADWLILPFTGLAMGYAGGLMGAKVAPRAKLETAGALGLLYLGALLRWAHLRALEGLPPARLWACVAMGAAGALLACIRARRLTPEDAPSRRPRRR